MRKPLVSLCMIVKNEEENLSGCLDSVRGLADEIIIVDTGSDDSTVAVAKSYGANVFSLPWQGDFAAARNQSISRATGEWIIYLDADERLDSRGVPDCLRKAASNPGVDAWSVNIRNHKFGSEAFDTTVNIRLFRRLPGVLFENEVHERIEPSLYRIGARIALAPFSIDHFGYSLPPEALRAKLERNLALSRKHLARRPDDSYCLYYVGITLLLLERHEESRSYFRKALETPDLPLFLNAMLCNLISYLDLLEGDDDGALCFAAKSMEMAPRQNTAYLLSGLAHFRKSDFAAALPLLTRACETPRLAPEDRQTDLSQEYAFIDEAESQNLIGTCKAELERYADAVPHFKRYMELRGSDPEVLRRAGICSINMGDSAAGLDFLERAVGAGAPKSELALPMAFAYLRLKKFDLAESFLDVAETVPGHDRETASKIRRLLESEGHKPNLPEPQASRAGTTVPDAHSADGPRTSPSPSKGKQAGACPKTRHDRRPLVSLCMIVKDEEHRLPGCLESVRGMVDEIVVVDTGSSDNTIEVAKSLGAKVFSCTWSGDFSKARNESLRHATGEWILSLDADERLEPLGKSDCLKKAASLPGADAFLVPIFNRGPEGELSPAIGSAVRFFRNLPGIRFYGRVHEAVDRFLLEAGAVIVHAEFAVDHFGYGQDPATVEGKYRRNLELLEAELAENPDNANAWYHLGLTHMMLKREKEARFAFDRALRTKNIMPSLEAMVLNMKGYHHLRAGELDQALRAASLSVGLVPLQNTGRLLKGLALFRKQAYSEALPLLIESYKYISTPLQERKSNISYEDSIDKSDLIEIIGTCFSETSRFREAVPFLKMTALRKEDPVVFERLGTCLLNTGDFPEAARYLKKALAAGASPVSLALPLCFAAFRTGDFILAAQYFMSAEPAGPDEIGVAFQLVRTMAEEEGFRPFLKDCLVSKRELFRGAFPHEFPQFFARFGPGDIPEASSGRMEA